MIIQHFQMNPENNESDLVFFILAINVKYIFILYSSKIQNIYLY